MKAAEFKKTIKEAKETLRGKTLKLHFVNGSNVEKMSFNTLRDFGKAILQLESKGVKGFGFIKVGNPYAQKGIYKPSQFATVLNSGVWNEVTFLATTVK